MGKPFMDYTRDDYDLITSVNLAGFFNLTQRVIGQMVL
jgi:NAD(P)-dependent dehydrogenase (short-subunit alcohol dehydrogenase family)